MEKTIFRIFCILLLVFQVKTYAQIKVSPAVQEALFASEERSYDLKEKEHAIAKTRLEADKIKTQIHPNSICYWRHCSF